MFKLPKENSAAHPSSLERRGFLIAAAGTGFTLAFLRADSSLAAGKVAPVPPVKASAPVFDPSIWFQIGRDGIVNGDDAVAGQLFGPACHELPMNNAVVDTYKRDTHSGFL